MSPMKSAKRQPITEENEYSPGGGAGGDGLGQAQEPRP